MPQPEATVYVPHSSQVKTALRALAQYHARLDRPPREVKAETSGGQLVVKYKVLRSLIYTAHDESVTVPGVSPALAAAGPAGLDAAIVAAGDAARARLPSHVPVIYSPSLPLVVPTAIGYLFWALLRPFPTITGKAPRQWKVYDKTVRGLLKVHAVEAIAMLAYNVGYRRAPVKIAFLWAVNQLLVGVLSFPAYFKLNPRSLALRPTRGF